MENCQPGLLRLNGDPQVLFCSSESLANELHGTIVGRADVQRRVAKSAHEARLIAINEHPVLVLIDREFPNAAKLIEGLREEPMTRTTSIVIVARGEMRSSELGLLEGGANRILRLPVTAEWDDRLSRLIQVPRRRDVRIPAQVRFQTSMGGGERVAGTVLNVSESGLLVECVGPFSVGMRAEISFRLPNQYSVAGTARVVRNHGDDRFGLEFLRIPKSAIAEINRFAGGDD